MAGASLPGRRPQKPDRIEWTEAELLSGKYKATLYTTTCTQGNKLEIIADYILRDAAAEVDEETGKKRGFRGDDPILFEEHIYQRRRREILNKNGIPDASIAQGMYWKAHPEGRSINSPQARERGAGYFR